MTEIKRNLKYLQVHLRYYRNSVTELNKETDGLIRLNQNQERNSSCAFFK
jgi:hypothetical protein